MAKLPWVLIEPLAVGGMGEVWRGRHTRSGRQVAIKVLTTEDARSPEAIDGFRAEVSAAASLDHPQIALVLDYGALPEAWERQSDGRLVAGSPFMVTEEARGGDLRRWVRRPPAWPTLSAALLQLLDALAFAHARGVIHRDLKPANVLLGTMREQRHGVLLADFGIAHRLSDLPEPGYRATAGTRAYMAPEQIAGDWRAYGPWTDLYALGVLTWAITQGELVHPMDGAGVALEWGVPRLNTPPGLVRWISRLLREEPHERFPNAAAAAAALRALAPAPRRRGVLNALRVEPLDSPTEPMAAPTAYPSGTRGASTLGHLLGSGRTMEPLPRVAPIRLEVEPCPVPPLEPPAQGRPHRAPGPPLDLVDAGLGLFGLRDRPIVGREAELDLLWGALREAWARRAPRVVLVSGTVGVGKSRLLRWLTERADELGVALTARARLGQDAEGGLLGMLQRALRVRGVPADERMAALERAWPGIIPEDERRAIATLLGGRDLEARSTSMSAGERYALILQGLRRVAGERPLVIALDDAGASPDGVGLARHLLSLSDGLAGPTTLVLARRDDAGVHDPPAELWAELARHPNTRSLALGPLPREDWPALASAGLTLSPALRDRVAERAAGNPLFAELIVDAWVRDGQLVVGHAGFELAPGVSSGLPESVSALVAEQLRALNSLGSLGDTRALQLAAVLGLEVHHSEWISAVARAGLSPAPDLLDRCNRLGLIHPTGAEGSFSFCHNMLRLSLLEAVAAEGTAAALHRAAAEAIEGSPGGGAERLGRLGRHRLAAGQPERAAPALLEAATHASWTGSHAELRTLLDLLEMTLPSLEGEVRDRTTARMWSLRGHLNHFGLGDRAEARRCYQLALEAAERCGPLSLVLDTRRRLGGVTFGLGEQRAAEAILRGALEAADGIDDHALLAEICCDFATVLHHGGQSRELQSVVDATLHHLNAAGRADLWARSIPTNWYLNTLPDLATREASLRRAATDLRRLRMLMHLGTALNQLGANARERGAEEEATRWYEEATAVLEEIGSSYVSMPRFNLAVKRWLKGDSAGAYAAIQRCLTEVLHHRWVWLEPHVRSFLGRLELDAGDPAAAAEQVERVRALWLAGGAAEYNVAETLDKTARRALEVEQRGLASQAGALGEQLYRAGGFTPQADDLHDYLISNHLI